jgi:hypothetical protein
MRTESKGSQESGVRIQSGEARTKTFCLLPSDFWILAFEFSAMEHKLVLQRKRKILHQRPWYSATTR